jgi:hypothetical protein
MFSAEKKTGSPDGAHEIVHVRNAGSKADAANCREALLCARVCMHTEMPIPRPDQSRAGKVESHRVVREPKKLV